MNKNKRIIIIIVSIVVLLILGFISMKVIYKTKIDEIKTVTTTKDEGLIKSIDCDMKITYVHELTETGYGTEYDFDLINIKEKKAYLVNDFDIWGNEKDPAKKGHNFTITPINLTDNDINMLKQLMAIILQIVIHQKR